MNANTVIIPDLEKLRSEVFLMEEKQEIFSIISDLQDSLGGNVTLSQLATIDDYYTTLASKEEWRNVRNNKAGYLPMRRAALALIKLAQAG